MKNWGFWTVVLEKTLESPLNSKIKPANPKGNQSWILIGGLMLKLKLQYFGHLMRRTDSLEKTLTLRKIEGRKRRGWQRMRWLDELVVHHWLYGHEFERAPGVSDGQGSLACFSPWGCKELDMTKWLNWTELCIQVDKQGVVPCPVLNVASWPAYRFTWRYVRWSGIPISLRIFHSLLWATKSKTLA